MLAGGVSPAHAAINYLVIQGDNTYAKLATVSISTTCPAGYRIHYYGIDDATGLYHWESGLVITSLTDSSVSSPAALFNMCVAGVPDSLSFTPSAQFRSGCTAAITAAFTLTAANSPKVLAICTYPNTMSGWDGTIYSGRLLLPDGFGINLYYGGYPGYTSWYLNVRGMVKAGDISATSSGYKGFVNTGAAFTGVVHLKVTISGNSLAWSSAYLAMDPPNTYMYVVGF